MKTGVTSHLNSNVQIVSIYKHLCHVIKKIKKNYNINCTHNVLLLQGPANTRIKATIDSIGLPYNEYNDCYHWLEFRDYLIGDRGKE